ncbi:MAG: hypothetical protein PHV10_07640 [Sulfuricurvum sp.]|nr:hypothetical protein [Sulfuricurvum sp.]
MRKETFRVAFDLFLIALGMWFFVEGVYAFAPAPLQLVAVKVVLVSGALLHAHVAGKALFPKVAWESLSWTPAHAVRMVIYAIVPIAYAIGG